MEEPEYRIVQVADHTFNVQRAYHSTYRHWPWSSPVPKVEWLPVDRIPFPFKSEEHAQKWIDDKRKYPIVVKQPA
jgi:hypothetical protein